jgi:hypothetical protein
MALQRLAAWAIALLALASAPPSAARADHGSTLLDDRLGDYLGIAQAHWGGPAPSCVLNGSVTLSVHAVLYDDPDPAVAARAEEPGCRLWLDRRHWRTMAAAEACMVVVHEWGHLLGHGHSAAPFSLMAELPIRPPQRCAALERGTRRARASRARARPHRSARGRRAQVGRKFRT